MLELGQPQQSDLLGGFLMYYISCMLVYACFLVLPASAGTLGSGWQGYLLGCRRQIGQVIIELSSRGGQSVHKHGGQWHLHEGEQICGVALCGSDGVQLPAFGKNCI